MSAEGSEPLSDLWPDEALADALGLVIAKMRAEWEREVERIGAEARAMVAAATAALAEVRAENAELRGLLRERVDGEVAQLKAALALVKNGEPGRDADPEVVVDLAARRVSAELTEAIRADVAAIQSDVQAIGAALDEKIAGHVAAAVADIPVPKDGKDGEDGKDADPEVVAAIVGERLQAEVFQVREDMEAELLAINQSAQSQLDTAIAALPVPKDGEPGKDADPEIVRALVVEELQQAVKSLPLPQDGHTPTEEELLPIIERVVQRSVDALPPAKDGEPGQNGLDGKDAPAVTTERVGEAVLPLLPVEIARYFEANPPPAGRPGRDGIDGKDGAPGKDGSNGLGIKALLIDRNKNLVATLDDGSVKELGPAIGSDGRNGADGKDGRDGKDAEIIDLFAPPDTTEHISKAVRVLNEIPAIHHQAQTTTPREKEIRIGRGPNGELIGKTTYGSD